MRGGGWQQSHQADCGARARVTHTYTYIARISHRPALHMAQQGQQRRLPGRKPLLCTGTRIACCVLPGELRVAGSE